MARRARDEKNGAFREVLTYDLRETSAHSVRCGVFLFSPASTFASRYSLFTALYCARFQRVFSARRIEIIKSYDLAALLIDGPSSSSFLRGPPRNRSQMLKTRASLGGRKSGAREECRNARGGPPCFSFRARRPFRADSIIHTPLERRTRRVIVRRPSRSIEFGMNRNKQITSQDLVESFWSRLARDAGQCRRNSFAVFVKRVARIRGTRSIWAFRRR